MPEENSIVWTAEKLARLKNVYDGACEEKLTEFKFDGHMLLISYAGYLIEYLNKVVE